MMEQDAFKNLLTRADRSAAQVDVPTTSDLITAVGHRARRRLVIRRATSFAAAAVLVAGISIWFAGYQHSRHLAQVQVQVQQLQEQTDRTLALVNDVLDSQREHDNLMAMEDELATINARLQNIESVNDQAAMRLLFLSHHMYNELDQKTAAIESYRRLVTLYPDNRWAQEAREKLEQIENETGNGNDNKGDES